VYIFSYYFLGIDKFDSDVVPIITGFIGQDKKGRITTLGRGGSDLTATFFGAAIRVDEIQVWKVSTSLNYRLFCLFSNFFVVVLNYVVRST
jgi:hypothetical protein